MALQNEPHKTSIGGQALIEGIMMRGPHAYTMAVRKPDGEIFLEYHDTSHTSLKWYKKTPFIRGCFSFLDSMRFGYKCLMRSADIAGLEEGEPSAFEKKMAKLFGNHFFQFLTYLSLVLGVLLAVALFIILPTFIASFIKPLTDSRVLLTLTEGILKLVIFLIYLALTTAVPDVKRLFMYHGAEHKSIFCYEAGEELTVENIRKQSRFHPRCGTSFLLIVIIISVFVGSFLPTTIPTALRMVLKILLLPIVVSISYEIIKLAGRYTNPVTKIISAPGMWLQRLTTKEPEDDQIEVAIASLKPVIPENKEDDKF